MKTTIRDIANQLGVSASTVSKVINGKGSISPELRQRVLAVVEHLWKRVDRASVDTADGQTLRFCMSGGLAWCGERDFFSLMHDADQLLYAAKQNRKGTCMIQPFIREASEP